MSHFRRSDNFFTTQVSVGARVITGDRSNEIPNWICSRGSRFAWHQRVGFVTTQPLSLKTWFLYLQQ